MILKIEAVEKSILVTLLLPHHLGHPILLMRLAYYSMVGFSTASADSSRSPDRKADLRAIQAINGSNLRDNGRTFHLPLMTVQAETRP
jgi:hypothetical protein